MRKTLLPAAIALLLFAATAGGAGTARAGETVARVNGATISSSAVQREVERSLRRGEAPDRSKILDSLIRRELLYQAALESGTGMQAGDVDREMTRLRANFVSAEAFGRELGAMGLSEEGLRDEIRRGMTVKAFVEKRFGSGAPPSGKEVRSWYDARPELFRRPARVRASHILVRVDSSWEEERRDQAREKMEAVRNRLRKGEDFGALARQYSECYSASAGGDLGYFERSAMQEPFAEAAFTLKPGETSDIVQTRDGFHLIRVAAMEPEGQIPFEEARQEVERRMKLERGKEGAARLIEEMRKKAQVEILSE